MADIKLTKQNEVHMFIECDTGIAHELQDFFSYKADGYRFHPKYKAKMWDGSIKLFSPYRRILYKGLIFHLEAFAKLRGYSIEGVDEIYNRTAITPQEVVEYVDALNLSAHGKPIKARDYQYYAVYHAIRNKFTTLISPTSSGKSLNIYATSRWYLDNYDKKVLIIVPSISLVTQLQSDFKDYATLVEWDADKEVHCITAGITKISDKRIFISTWQSLIKQPKAWYKQFGMVYNDEVHNSKALSLKNILEKTTTTEFRIGTTGTTGSKKVNELLIQGLFGKIKKVITTKELMDRNEIAKLKIMCVGLQYPEIERKECRNKTYQEEVDFLVKHTKRNKMIIDSIGDMEGNTLLLVNKIAHIKILHELAVKKYPDKNIYVIYGATPKEERERIRQAVDASLNSILIATYGTLSTGISIRNLDNVIFGSSSKSEIRVLQSLGRGLRLSERKTSVILYDIFDDLSINKHKNFGIKHFIERFKIYSSENFTMENIKIEL